MNSVPSADQAEIDPRKLTEYLLAASHPVGQAKARFFGALGFNSGEPAELDRALRSLLAEPDRILTEDTAFGRKYIVDGTLRGSRASAPVRSVWIVEHGTENPRFVTAYPRRAS
jgi:hypothetical protein